MKYRPGIGVADFDTKNKKVEEFLAKGHQVKITVMFRGRLIQHPELGEALIDDIIESISSGKPAGLPKLTGNDMTLMINPKKK